MASGANLLPCLAVLTSIVSLTVGTSFGKHLFASVGPEGTSSLRVGIAAILMLAFWRPWKQPLDKDAIKRICIYGLVMGCMNFSFYMSLDTLPLGIAIAIEFTGPLVVAILSSRKALDFLWIILAVLGLAMLLPITPNAVSLNPVGVAFAFAAATLWGLYIIFGKRVGHLPAGQTTSYGMMIGGILLFPFGITHVGAKVLDPNIMVSALRLAIASSAIPYTLEMYALKRLPRNTFSILLSLEPAVGAISGMLILSEQLNIQQWIAIASVMLASIGSAVTSKPHEMVEIESQEAADAEIVA